MAPRGDTQGEKGRRQHIQSVLRIFRRRGVDGKEGMPLMAAFLNSLFGLGGSYALTVQSCRHQPGGKHDAQALLRKLPCRCCGTADGVKAPKLVVSDLRKKARAFCKVHGRGEIQAWRSVEPPGIATEEAEE